MGHSGRVKRALVGAGLLATLAVVGSACSGESAGGGADTTTSADGSKVKCSFDNSAVGIDRSAQFAVNVYGGAAVDETKAIAINSGTLAVGSTTDIAFEIKNNASLASAAELIVTKINVQYTGGDGAFECLVADKDGKALQQGGKAVPCLGHDFGSIVPNGFDPGCVSKPAVDAGRFLIRFKKIDGSPRTTDIVIVANGDTSRATVKVKLETKAGKSTIDVSPDPVDFGVVGVGGSGKVEEISITNNGDAPV